MTETWIQEAIKREGSLKKWLLENRAKVKAWTGEDPFTAEGKIKMSVLKKLHEMKDKLDDRIWHKVHLAITLKKLAKKKKK